MYKYPYLLLKHLLGQIPELKEIEIDYGQETTKGALKTLPTVLIRFRPTTWNSLARGEQEATQQIDITTITESYSDPSQKIDQAGALDHYEVTNLVHTKLDGHSFLLSDLPQFASLKGTENDYVVMNSFARIFSQDRFQSASLKTDQRYRTQLIDKSANKTFTHVIKGLEIENMDILS